MYLPYRAGVTTQMHAVHGIRSYSLLCHHSESQGQEEAQQRYH